MRLLLLACFAVGCQVAGTQEALREIPLSGPAAHPASEISGLAWHGDTLFLVAEECRTGLYLLELNAIRAYLSGNSAEPLRPEQVPIERAEILRDIPNFDGIEALAFDGDTAYFLMESRRGCAMEAYLARGVVNQESKVVTVDDAPPVPIGLAHQACNLSAESIVIHGGRVIVLEEANGKNLIALPRAHVFSPALQKLDSLPIPSIEYRVTDATGTDSEGRFWAINYLWPPERRLLNPADDPEDADAPVELLLEFQVGDAGIVRTEAPPINLRQGRAPNLEPHNWEGIVRLDDLGFLVVTDTFPRTVFGFVALPAR